MGRGNEDARERIGVEAPGSSASGMTAHIVWVYSGGVAESQSDIIGVFVGPGSDREAEAAAERARAGYAAAGDETEVVVRTIDVDASADAWWEGGMRAWFDRRIEAHRELETLRERNRERMRELMETGLSEGEARRQLLREITDSARQR